MCFRSLSMTRRRLEEAEVLWRKIHSTSRRIGGFPASISGRDSRETGFMICRSVKTGVLLQKAHGTTFWEDGSGAATSRLDPVCTSRQEYWAEGWTSGAA